MRAPSVAVVYLSRGAGGGRSAAQRFFETYREYPSGQTHDLFVITKGWQAQSGLPEVCELATDLSATIVDLPDDGFDWGAYFRLAWSLKHEWFCFLNTHTRFCEKNWLDMLLSAALTPGVGAAGATGSWGTLVPQFRPLDLTKLGILLFPLRFLSTIWRFPAFPNPHLRSNAFIVRREIFLAFASQRVIPRTKREAHLLESGRSGFTRFLSQRGLIPVVVGKDGKVFKPEEWIDSETFRVFGQRNLLIKDNQTENYDHAGHRLKKISEISAWGKSPSGGIKKNEQQ